MIGFLPTPPSSKPLKKLNTPPITTDINVARNNKANVNLKQYFRGINACRYRGEKRLRNWTSLSMTTNQEDLVLPPGSVAMWRPTAEEQ